MTEALYLCIGAVVGSLATLFLDRGIRWRRPRVSTETGNLARRSVNTARRVFGGALAHGGRLTYPWDVDGEKVLEDRLADDLRQAAARIGNKEFTAKTTAMSEHLRGIYASQPRSQVVFFIGDDRPETPSEREWRESDDKKAAKQREHAEAGMDLIEPTLARLDGLEKHS